MARTIRFNKTTLTTLVREHHTKTTKDSEVPGLQFKVGAKRSVFQFEKRISGRKGSPITMTIGAFPVISIEEARQEARRLANLCEKALIRERRKRSVQPSKNSEFCSRMPSPNSSR